ncbi:hypothetical protein [Saccharibacillus kuerlensis]|uniref:Lipoprotein n=1 Tax=Saccharibacillus kuerlensis TaxID=459527 RepID=A0ABQ2LBH0_9BACL|nr:hypothetical protein [Saccharibacillus kuerlensis]GGO09448.1 hypothetical protein GCM10010969_39880 [Saccharibacillus kuerlensis]
MKKILAAGSVMLLSLSVLGCSDQNPSVNRTEVQGPKNTSSEALMDYAAQDESQDAAGDSTMELAEHFSTLESLANSSQLIAEVVLDGKTEKFDYEGAEFILSSAAVTDVISGDRSYLNTRIDLLDVASFHMQPAQDSNRFILFMIKYEGPVVSEEAFVTRGVYQGRFAINENNQIYYEANTDNGTASFQDKIQNMNVEDFKRLIESSIDKS